MSLEQLLNESLPATSYGHRADLGVIGLTGPDSAKFLQGQATADIKLVDDQHSVFGAVCTPKGRIIANFFVLKNGTESYLLVAKQDVIDTLLTHLKKYAVFFKTSLEDVSGQYNISSMFARTEQLTPQEQYAQAIPTSHQEGCSQLTLDNTYFRQTLTIAAAQEELPDAEDESAHQVMTLLAARPLLGQAHVESILPQWINMHRNGGISFTKGCYTGQEIVARMKYRGKSKKHLALISSSAPLEVDADVVNGEGKTIGSVFASAAIDDLHVAQIMLNIDQEEVDQAFVNDQTVELLPLPYQIGS
ncbi:YgfZ/GcvT domain-containing protein [Marinomonas ostreistagni]|uniref:CAF17-like 4Fe-4S cluster assembly/insertion protein YgfZ n=1 Tax=Marinomonas ostreistagni TaxID=359209 RepID=UPI00194FF112|nr:folate-binding protein YgfZ [Marinomonas ostreistagni]MBM6551387.1 folate-binding protein YgfZ [Marinomonas ostreistagni]